MKILPTSLFFICALVSVAIAQSHVPVYYNKDHSDLQLQNIPGSNLFVGIQDRNKDIEATAVETDDAIELKIGEQTVLKYNKSTQTGPEGTEPHFARSGYIHPVYNPDGQAVTGDFAADHKHQHALFFAWTRCKFEGKKVEFWNQKLELGRVAHSKVISTTSGPVFAQFVVELSWAGTKANVPILEETWTVRAYNTGADFFLFDVESSQQAAGESPLTIEKYHYGGMAIRGHDQWFGEDANFLTDEGKNRKNGNHSRPKWVDIFGHIDGKHSGVAVLSHPSNFRFPQHVRLHPEKPYFCFAPMVEEPFEITNNEAYVSRYRYLVHTGEVDVDLINKHWDAYSN
ncbi:MAG: PmoA family protein [Verrucomicrobiota bacterium]